jgi:putative endonuclease
VEDNKLNSKEDGHAVRNPALSLRAAVGRAGEEAAANQLQLLGYRLVERNWRCRAGEVDLIAEDGATLVFVEVRSRKNPTRFGTAVEAVTPRKCRQVRELATIYLKQHKLTPHSIRFDVVAVTFDLDGAVRECKHLQSAF